MRSLVNSIFLYARKSWTLTAELEKRTQAFEVRCYRRLLDISYKDHVTNEEVHRKIQAAFGEYDELMTLFKKRKLRLVWPCFKVFWFSKDNPTGHSERKKKKRQTEEEVGKQYQRVDRNGLCQLKDWTGMDFASSTRAAENRTKWKGIVANSSVVPRRPSKVIG